MAKKKSLQEQERDIGIDANPPKRQCNDSKCPWHGFLPVRGKVFVGKVVSDKSSKTVIVEWGYHHYLPKYERYERRRTRIAAYNPQCIDAKVGDTVRIAECRPLSKTKHFIVVEKIGEKK